MSFKPSKKTLIKLSPAASSSHDKAADSAPSAQPPSSSCHGGRSRKSFFSFKPTSKRSFLRPVGGQEPAETSKPSKVQFPVLNGKNEVNQTALNHSPPQIPLPTRTLRSSILFSQQFDFNHLGSNDESIHLDPSPTSLTSDIKSRPFRSTTRPSSWMMLQDGSYAPSLKAQVQGVPQSNQLSPESFYNRSSDRVLPCVDSSDDDRSSHASAASWNRLPYVPQAEQPSHLKGILAGYQLQTQTQEPSPTKLPAVSRPVSKPDNVPFTPSFPSCPTGPPKGSDYSPLAAFLGQSKSLSPVVSKKTNCPSSAASNGLLSTFLGSQASDQLQKNPALVPLSSAPPVSQLSSFLNPQPQPAKQSARLEEPIRLEESRRVGPTSVKKMFDGVEGVIKIEADTSPTSDNQFASSPSMVIDVIDATGTDRSSVRREPKAGLASLTVASSGSKATLALSASSSPRSTSCDTLSSPSVSILEKCLQSTSRANSTSDSGSDDLKNKTLESLHPEARCGSRKRGVENVYLDSSSQHSSICSDNFSSVDDAMRKCAIDSDLSDLSGALTAPSSTCSRSSSASEKTLESIQHQKEEVKVKINDFNEMNVVQHDDPSSDQVIKEHNNSSADMEKSVIASVSDEMEEEAEVEDDTSTRRRTINFEHLLLRHPEILRKVINHLCYFDFFSLSQVTNDFLEELESDPRLREIVLKRYLTGFGYRTCPTRFIIEGDRKRELPTITLSDLTNFYAGLEFESLELIEYSKQALNRKGLDYRTAKMIRSSTRAHNKLVAYMRTVEELSPRHGSQQALPHRHAGRSFEPIYRHGKAPIFKVWVPSADHWMSNEELAECERELWRSQIWSYLKKGDVCWNLAIGDFANEGKLIFDGKFLRDLLFDFDEVGHLPSWLDMLAFPPSYFHKIISSSNSTPIFYLGLSDYKDEIKKNLKLSQDKVEVASPQARYRVQRWVYISYITIPKGDWKGHVVIEVEGTSEHAQDLLKRCCGNINGGTKNLTPWRIIREKSRPGKLWIKPVNDDERIN